MADRRDERIEALSGGEEASVAVAGALAMEPDFLILDEPLAGLDLTARESVLAHLDDLHDDGTAVLVVTHDLRDLLGRADRLLGMDGGRLVADVPPAEARDALEGIAVRVPEC
jgi:biotin transport system ATP-binding protein